MGIPYFFYNLYKRYTNDRFTISQQDVTDFHFRHLFLDYNSLIHPCAQRVISNKDQSDAHSLESDIIQECIRYTKYVMHVVSAKNVYIMIDGVAPRAKINQQRERRYKSVIMKELLTGQEHAVKWDSNRITPGTLFMEKLKAELIAFACDVRAVGFDVYISDASENGEGEHKMMKYIREHITDEKICIYGLDADLIMLSMLNKCSDHIVLLRDNTSAKNNQEPNSFVYLKIESLKAAIVRELSSKINGKLDHQRLIQDYIFLCFLLGNDFVGHLPSVTIKDNGVSVLINSYVKVMNNMNGQTYLVDGVDLNIEMFMSILSELANSEEYFFQKVYSPYKHDSDIIYRDAIPLSHVQINANVRCYAQDVIKYNQTGFRSRYYTYYGINDLDDLCYNYMQSLFWILWYYNPNECTNDNWSWYFKYNATPFVTDLLRYLHRSGKDTIYKCQQSVNVRTEPLSAIQQLLLVLPAKSLLQVLEEKDVALQKKLCRMLKTNSSWVQSFFPDVVVLDLIHKEYLWQAKMLTSHCDINLLNTIIT